MSKLLDNGLEPDVSFWAYLKSGIFPFGYSIINMIVLIIIVMTFFVDVGIDWIVGSLVIGVITLNQIQIYIGFKIWRDYILENKDKLDETEL